MDTQDTIHDGKRPLANRRHEAFCLAYAGRCWGNGTDSYLAAGYRPKSRDTAKSCASTLTNHNPAVRARIDCLRQDAIWELGADRTRILQERMAILTETDAEGCRVDASIRLAALRDIEKSMGLTAPEKVVHEHQGEISHQHAVRLDDEVLEAMRAQVRVLQETWNALEAGG